VTLTDAPNFIAGASYPPRSGEWLEKRRPTYGSAASSNPAPAGARLGVEALDVYSEWKYVNLSDPAHA
jgi:hypothetical protein